MKREDAGVERPLDPRRTDGEEAGDKKGKGISRRAFCTGGVAVAAMLAVGGIGAPLTGNASLVRPPGAQSDTDLLGMCIKCDRCRSACPHSAIDIAHIEKGLLNARTPVMNFRKGYCDFCEGESAMRCVQVCPTQAIKSGFDPAGDKLGIARVDFRECLLNRSSSCWKPCIESCTFDALSLDDAGLLVVDERLCNGCGACEYVCPSSSYGSYTGSNRRGINVEISEKVDHE